MHLIDLLPILLMLVWAGLILALNIQGSRLLRLFQQRYPEVAQREIPYAVDRWIFHPEKALFWYRGRAGKLLRNDPELWRERQRYVRLSIAILVFLITVTVMIVVGGAVLSWNSRKQGAAAIHRAPGQGDDSGKLASDYRSHWAPPAAVAELGRYASPF